MNAYFQLVPILFPILCGAALGLWKPKKRIVRESYVLCVTLLNSACILLMLLYRPEGEAMIVKLAGSLAVTFRMDGASCVFAGLIGVLWPIASLYGFEYMEHEGRENTFFAFYTMTYGVTVGIALSANLMTMYMFYEMLTLVTIPLMMHALDYTAVVATRKYVRYSIGGAAFAFIGFIAIAVYGETIDFRLGGVLTQAGNRTTLLIVYVMAVLGFGVKAAIFPFHGWLPSASVAPTPVTALLHAVAVVKAGAFAIIRITYYSFGTDFLRGSWAQYTVMAFAMVTMVYGAANAVKEQQCKRRLAFSTISNLSYIIFAASLMTEAGMAAAWTHMICHGIMKITLFYCVGALLVKTGKRYIWEMDGGGKTMPFIFAIYTIAGISLVGIPPFMGFVSKWSIGTAAVDAATPASYIGLGALILSALLCAAYVMEVVIRAWLPQRRETAKTAETAKPAGSADGENASDSAGAADKEIVGEDGLPVFVTNGQPGWRMRVPLVILTILIILGGIFSTPLTDFFLSVARGDL